MVRGNGKQLRGRLLRAAAELGGRAEADAVYRAAVAVELFHSGTLAHDDIIDDAALRRGRPTVATAYGSSLAVLTGGWLFARAALLLSECGLGDESPVARFAETACEVCEGQMLELRELFNPDRSRKSYLSAVQGKTASVFAFAAYVGARLGGADRATSEELSDYGRHFGAAFQVADDVLDLVADVEDTGKTTRLDLLHGVYTLPVICALEQRPDLRDILLMRPGQQDAAEVITLIQESGGLRRCAELGLELGRRARETAVRNGSAWLTELVDAAVIAPLSRCND
jgi:heptaprenyl diphosphate synthase